MIVNDFGPHEMYIYALVDPRNFDVRYIGQTNNLRLRYKQHLSSEKAIDFVLWWWDAVEFGDDVIMYVVCGSTRDEVNQDEQTAIDTAIASGHQLFNIKGTDRKPPKYRLCVKPPIPYAKYSFVREKAVSPALPPKRVPQLRYSVMTGNSTVHDPRYGYNEF